MFFWRAFLKDDDDNLYFCDGIFRYSKPKLAEKEFNKMMNNGDLPMYLISKGIPAGAKLFQVIVATFFH